ncbi:MAG: hypothetical protein LBC41_13770 [Clostridiales bacterium]|jgi:DNA-directed RNA polymerase subunit RPC12/RpoP|nr:hypothetical protein [Clostridiales bacterium]
MPVQAYSCANCGGALRYGIAEKAFVCEHCSAAFSFEEMLKAYPEDESGAIWAAANERAKDRNDYETKRILNGETEEDISVCTCPSCGAEILSDSETQASGNCALCGNPVTITERLLSGETLPSRLIPFKLAKGQAGEILKNILKNKPLLPREFMKAAKEEKLNSVYVPFFLFDADCSASITARCVNTSHWSDSDYRYTKTDVYEARRSGAMSFAGIPLDASEKMDDGDMRAMEPFDMKDLQAFSSKYLSGHSAEAPTSKLKDLEGNACAKLRPAAQAALLKTATGYDSVTLESGSSTIDTLKSEYVMLPVWTIRASHKGKDFAFSINGQTGKFTGSLPVDWKRAWTIFGIAFASVFMAMIIVWEVALCF